MAEINKIILKIDFEELYRYDKFKLSSTLIPGSQNSISESLSVIDDSIVISNSLDKNITGIGIDNSLINLTKKDYTPEIGIINTLRNQGGVNLSIKEAVIYNQSYNSTLIEKIPDNIHSSEYLQNLKNINLINEYPMKQSMLKRMARIYGEFGQTTPYATNLWMLPLGIETPVTIETGGRLSSSINKIISGYIKVTDTNINAQMNLVMRGVPVPMRRVLTSKNYSAPFNIPSSYNYVFIYPQYIVNNIELIQSIDYIEITGYAANPDTKVYYSNNYEFSILDAEGYNNNLAPLNIINREFRNIE